MTDIITAASGTYVLLIGPIEDPEKVNWDDTDSWCRKTPVVAWAHTGNPEMDFCLPLGPGREAAHGDVFLLPGGKVYCAAAQHTYETLSAYIQAQWFEGSKRPVLAGDSVSAEKTLAELGLSKRATNPLQEAGISTLTHLAQQERAAVGAVKGVSRDTLKVMDGLLEAEGLGWGGTYATASTPPQIEDNADDPEDLI